MISGTELSQFLRVFIPTFLMYETGFLSYNYFSYSEAICQFVSVPVPLSTIHCLTIFVIFFLSSKASIPFKSC